MLSSPWLLAAAPGKISSFSGWMTGAFGLIASSGLKTAGSSAYHLSGHCFQCDDAAAEAAIWIARAGACGFLVRRNRHDQRR